MFNKEHDHVTHLKKQHAKLKSFFTNTETIFFPRKTEYLLQTQG